MKAIIIIGLGVLACACAAADVAPRSVQYKRDVDHAAMGHVQRRNARPIDVYDNAYVRSRREINDDENYENKCKKYPTKGCLWAYSRNRRDVDHAAMGHDVQRRSAVGPLSKRELFKRSISKRKEQNVSTKESTETPGSEDVKLDAQSLGYPMYGGYYRTPLYGYGRYGYPMYGGYGYGGYPMYGGYYGR